MKSLLKLALVALPIVSWTTISQSAPITDMPSTYGPSSHANPTWQRLGYDANINDGVTWSVDNGATWGNDELFVGQTVKFKFHMHKKAVGNHYADHLGAWLDFGQDGSFDSSDQIAYGEHMLSTSKGVVNTAVESSLGEHTPNTPDIYFYSNSLLLSAAHAGETWLRAVVACSESIVETWSGQHNWDAQWSTDYKDNYQDRLLPVGHYHQGETENYKIVINQVSEPATFALMGLGLFGLAAARKRMK